MELKVTNAPCDVYLSSLEKFSIAFTKDAVVCWGANPRKGAPTVHLPALVVKSTISAGRPAACRPNGPNLVTWTFEYGFQDTPDAKLCKRCFSNGLPRERYRPKYGWVTYSPLKTIAAAELYSGNSSLLEGKEQYDLVPNQDEKQVMLAQRTETVLKAAKELGLVMTAKTVEVEKTAPDGKKRIIEL